MTNDATEHLEAMHSPGRIRFGEFLIQENLISQEQLQDALNLQNSWKSRLGDIILSKRWMRPIDFYQALAQYYGLSFINLMNDEPDPDLFDPGKIDTYASQSYLPWKRNARGGITFALADTTPELIGRLKTVW